MNISTGGLHILLFERDQQLAGLLMSELQLVGYEGHTARTAVEVFDAIARYPVRLVLVNLAQAAAARREFWVALDTQRRGSSIQVLTFYCSNLAGYGPRDFEERQAMAADMEIDGMLGIVKLLDAVRARVPNADVNANTVPQRTHTNSSPAATTSRFTQPIPVPNSITDNSNTGNEPVFRNTFLDERNNRVSVSRISAASLPHTPPTMTPVSPAQAAESSSASQIHQASQMYSPSGTNSQATYSEKIRAVIYPSQQRNRNTPTATNQGASWQQDSTAYVPYASQASAYSPHLSSDSSVLQRLATGQPDPESGLAQLTRIAQGSQVPNSVPPVRTPRPDDTYVPLSYTPPTARVGITNEAISSQSLRPAPIEDLPEGRPTTNGSLSIDGQKRQDVLSRANYNQQSSPSIPYSAAQSPLASIATSEIAPASPSTSVRREAVEDTNRPNISKDAHSEIAPAAPPTPVRRDIVEEDTDRPNISKGAQKSKEDPTTVAQTKIEVTSREKEAQGLRTEKYTDKSSLERKREEHKERKQDEVQNSDEETLAKNSVILDILQSFPAMPALAQQQGVQPQVLNGRATRSLGSVLLDGHLVPEERLEVAQNIQRMLRGVDLNYQLGEILLMFKLLTPDQLLAASLVSYGLITTTQIGAFGRVRQELHAIGLEYDLENLLILFRVLTPEQLREARSNIQS